MMAKENWMFKQQRYVNLKLLKTETVSNEHFT